MLPPEIRNMIYTFALLPEREMYPFKYTSKSRQRPAVALLSVNKQIHNEATPILYSKAIFNVTTGKTLALFMVDLELPDQDKPYEHRMYPSRHFISRLCIDFVPISFETSLIPRDSRHMWSLPVWQYFTPHERMLAMHETNLGWTEDTWGMSPKITPPQYFHQQY